MKRDILDRLVAAKAAATPVAIVTDLNSGLQSLVLDDAVHGAFGLEPEILEEVRRRIRQDRSGVLTDPQDEDGFRLFVHVHNPAMRLLIVGAVHIAQALAPLAVLSGYDVTVIDPRGAFATEARFPGIKLNHDWPDEGLTALAPDVRTAIVTLSHDPKLDDPALIAALRSPAFYVGALGSKRTHALRLDRLRDEGLSEAQVKRIRGPVGLSIGAVTPAEIALSILGQITCVRRGENHPC
ncbi:xanthine dehydrogenase [Azospirillum cavernae]|uniref:Xanthine dehydrogenase n=1 Tax=Azospirillum cavernae TaxID=2320860 RepID=A0A418W1D3_9PROT|nr:XdhC family protein [Azospirillum cavernae]RJF83826.1 xanthine dehydrogenase [Azospirillum cavernae]